MTVPGPLRSKKLRALVPIAVLSLVLSACSPGTAATIAAIFGGQITTYTSGNAVAGPTFPSDYIKLNVVCIVTGGHCSGYASGAIAGGAHFVTYNLGGGGGFFKLDGGDCSTYPCPEGGRGAFAGNGSIHPPLTAPFQVSYSIDSFDYDNPDGTQSAPDTIKLNICNLPGIGPYCGIVFTPNFTETFTCTDTTTATGKPVSCYEVTVRPGSIGPTQAQLIAKANSLGHH